VTPPEAPADLEGGYDHHLGIEYGYPKVRIVVSGDLCGLISRVEWFSRPLGRVVAVQRLSEPWVAIVKKGQNDNSMEK
jgi:hypothetical protein